jgi:Skp family chaperone for outer membrane proteins
MKYFVKFLVVTFFFLQCTYALAEQKIVYLDMTFVLNKSKAGEGAQIFLKKTFEENQKKFIIQENELKNEESDLLGKKNVLTKEEYKKNSEDLRKKVLDYQKQRRAFLAKVAKQRSESRQILLQKIDPILKTYSQENNVTLVIDKKFILSGNTDLDITEIIVEKLNKEFPSLNLQ